MFGAGLSILSGAIGLGASALGAGGSLLSSAFGAGQQAGGAVVGGVLGGISKALQGGSFAASVSTAIGGALTGAIVAGITSSVKSAVARSQSILTQSQATGWGIGSSTRAAYNAGAFGIGSDKLPQQNAMIGGLGASVYGGDGSGSARDLAAYRQFYQRNANSGPMGLMLAQSVEGMTGREGFRGMANLDDSQFNKQMSRSGAMQSALGSSPDEIRRGAQEMTLLGASFSQFFGLLRDKGGNAIIRNLTIPLSNTLDWIIGKGDALGKGIEQGVDSAFAALHRVGEFLYSSLPLSVLSGVETMAGAASELATLLPETFSELGQMVKYSLLEAIAPIPIMIGELFAPVGDYLQSNVLPPVIGFFKRIEDSVRALAENPQIAAFLRTLGRIAPVTNSVNNAMGDAARAMGSRGENGEPGAAEDAMRGGGGMLLAAAAGKRLLFGGGTGGGGSGAFSLGRWIGRGIGAVGRGIGTVGRLAMGGISGTAAAVGAAGVGLGVAGYEGLRALNIGGFGDTHASSSDIMRHYFGGDSRKQEDAPQTRTSAVGDAVANVRASFATGSANASDWWSRSTQRPAWSGEITNAPKNDFNHSLKGLRDSFIEKANSIEKMAADKRAELGSEQERREAYKAWHQIAQNTKKTADNTEETNKQLLPNQMQIAGRAVANYRQDIAREMIRASGGRF